MYIKKPIIINIRLKLKPNNYKKFNFATLNSVINNCFSMRTIHFHKIYLTWVYYTRKFRYLINYSYFNFIY
jgi:hypothetical protein